ncbi:S-layer homology domain-containing protein [Fusobacterium sp.]|uniref:S-layer homology domain-containing protein n=1 Tax=Fusobacterium sp. TaxID=68766 RepID=UPI00396CDBA3
MKYIILINMLIFSITFADVKYEDVSPEHWAYSSINSLSEKGILTANRFKFDGNSPLTRYDFAYNLARAVDYIDLTKANKEDLNILESLMLEFSQELNKIGFDASTFNSRLNTTDETIEILRARINENEKTINDLKKRVEILEDKS